MPRVLIKKYDYAVKDFCSWLKGEMSRNGMSQENMASVLGITQQAFSYKMRCGAFKLKELMKIFSFLGTDSDKIAELLMK